MTRGGGESNHKEPSLYQLTRYTAAAAKASFAEVEQ